MSSKPDELYLSDVSPCDNKWDRHRAEADIVASLYRQTSMPRYGARIEKCAGWLGFKWALTGDDGELKLKLKEARFCRCRQCPVCSWRRTLMWQSRFLKMLDEYTDVMIGTGATRFIFMTLTVRNCEPTKLRQTIKEMQTAWNRLVALKEWPAVGFVKSVEVTRNPDTGEAHPHFHCVLMVPGSYFSKGYLSKLRWAELWQQCLRVNYTPSIHVKAVRANSGDALRKALHETLKYSVKPADVAADPAWLEVLTEQMHNVRSVSVGGSFRNFLKATDPDNLITEEENNDDVEETDLTWAAWKQEVRRYRIVKPV